MSQFEAGAPKPKMPRKRPVMGPKLRVMLTLSLGLFTFLSVNGLYLMVVRIASEQSYFYHYMFLTHLVAGVVAFVPVLILTCGHMWLGYGHRNKKAVRRGYPLAASILVLLASGVFLMRLDGLPQVSAPYVRDVVWWIHFVAPIAVAGLFVFHRKATRAKVIKWRLGGRHLVGAAGLVALMTMMHVQDPRQWNLRNPEAGDAYFEPSLARTASGGYIPVEALTNDDYCAACHADAHEQWQYSAHHLGSFNNPAYLASVRETRRVMNERQGSTKASRWCAGCHDPAPFFSGAFEDDRFDDPEYDLASDPLAQAGINCTSCHAITSINSPRGNADYTIEEPLHYPFAFSDNKILQWVNHSLIRANPDFHKKTFLKPLHKTAEFCGSCHKVHLPEELNDYKFLRGQNHYDAYLLSGVSGHGVTSFYYPPVAVTNCNQCHMPLHESADFGAKYFDDSGELKIHDHQFPSANTALAALLNLPDWVNLRHQEFLEGVMRVDIFGVKEGGGIEGELHAPLRPAVPTLTPGETYLLETLIRTVKMGHVFTQGTADSNEVWMDVTLTQGGRVIGRSGGLGDGKSVDPWSHYANAFVIDRNGFRINRRNAQDIFIPLYSNQIPPGAADVVHYRFKAPEDSVEPITAEVKLNYRKFDTEFLRIFQEDPDAVNDLPIVTLATDKITFPVEGGPGVDAQTREDIPEWQRWNDYGIAALLEGGEEGSNRGELRQAEEAFRHVEELGKPDGPVNLARVYIKEGRMSEAVTALDRASSFDPPPPPWTYLWFTGVTNQQNGALDEAIANFRAILTMDSAETRERKLDFSLDYRVWNQLGGTLFDRSKQERGEERKERRESFLQEAADAYEQALTIDPENVTAHYGLSLVYDVLGESKRAAEHRTLHSKYKVDDNARAQAIISARSRYPAADHAAESIVIWDLQREGAFELPAEAQQTE